MTIFYIKMKIRAGGGALGQEGGVLGQQGAPPAIPLYGKHSLQVSRSNYTNYRQTYQLNIIIPVGQNCIGQFGYGPKLLWAEMSSDHPARVQLPSRPWSNAWVTHPATNRALRCLISQLWPDTLRVAVKASSYSREKD